MSLDNFDAKFLSDMFGAVRDTFSTEITYLSRDLSNFANKLNQVDKNSSDYNSILHSFEFELKGMNLNLSQVVGEMHSFKREMYDMHAQKMDSLKNIEDTLKTPNQTESYELSKIGQELLSLDELEEAQTFLEDAYKKNPLNNHAILLLINLFTKIKDYENALKYAIKYQRRNSDLQSNIILANIYLFQNEQEKALDILLQAEDLTTRPKKIYTYEDKQLFLQFNYQLSGMFAQTKDVKNSIHRLKIILEQRPEMFGLIAMDPLFAPIRNNVNTFLRKLKESYLVSVNSVDFIVIKNSTAKLKDLKEKLIHNWDCNKKLDEIISRLKKLIEMISSFEEESYNNLISHSRNLENQLSYINARMKEVNIDEYFKDSIVKGEIFWKTDKKHPKKDGIDAIIYKREFDRGIKHVINTINEVNQELSEQMDNLKKHLKLATK